MTVHHLADALPDVTVLRDRGRALAMLDALVCADPDERTYLYDSRWRAGCALASMNNGQGDEYSIVFDDAGVFIRGFDHESPLTPFAGGASGLVAGLPGTFAGYLEDDAFGMDGLFEATVCLWREHGDPAYRHGEVGTPEAMLAAHPGIEDPDGADRLFEPLTVDDPASAYLDLALDVYDRPLDLAAVRHVLALRPLTPEIVRHLSGGTPPEDLAEEIERIGYPREPTDPVSADPAAPSVSSSSAPRR